MYILRDSWAALQVKVAKETHYKHYSSGGNFNPLCMCLYICVSVLTYTKWPWSAMFEIFCWLYRLLVWVLMLWVFASSSTTPQPFSSWLHLICCGLRNQIMELIKIVSKIRSSRLWVKRASCGLWTEWGFLTDQRPFLLPVFSFTFSCDNAGALIKI